MYPLSHKHVICVTADGDKDSVGITLKCDLYERMLDPTLLPTVTNHFVSVSVMSCDLLVSEADHGFHSYQYSM